MENSIREIREKALAGLAEVRDTAGLEQLRVHLLGKQGELTGILRGMGQLPADKRPAMGQLVNEARAAIEEALERRLSELRAREKDARLKAEAIDVTLPV